VSVLDDEAIDRVTDWAMAYGRRYFRVGPILPEALKRHITSALFSGRQPIWTILEECLVSEREARDLLLNKIHDFFRIEMKRGGVMGIEEIEDLAELELALFGQTPPSEKPGLRSRPKPRA
jgi:hypothetical protein